MLFQGKYGNYPITITRKNGSEWNARTGNLVTTSRVNREACIENHIKKLDKQVQKINLEERETERNCFCY